MQCSGDQKNNVVNHVTVPGDFILPIKDMIYQTQMVKVAARVSRYSRGIKKQLRDIVKEACKRAGRVVAHVLELGYQLVPQLLVNNRHLARL